jgi:mannitol/fructose-specific phosphotransferase system IIA component (Ntr-type)
MHLAILARLSRLLADHLLLEKLLAAATAEEVVAAVSRTEEKLG